jgi:hypothetical protein
MRFWPVEEFKFWENDKLIAHYLPALSYQVRPEDDRLSVLLMGGALPGAHSVFIEKGNALTEVKPGQEIAGWVADGLMTLVPPPGQRGGGGVSGSAESGRE